MPEFYVSIKVSFRFTSEITVIISFNTNPVKCGLWTITYFLIVYFGSDGKIDVAVVVNEVDD